MEKAKKPDGERQGRREERRIGRSVHQQKRGGRGKPAAGFFPLKQGRMAQSQRRERKGGLEGSLLTRAVGSGGDGPPETS